MAVLSMRTRLALVLSMSLLVLQSGVASAQDAPAQPNGPATITPRRYKLDTVCAASLDRFCPALATNPGQTRNQVICLKSYRTSLPLSCRSAVTALMR